MSSAISEEKNKINLACRWVKFNAANKNASKTAFTSTKCLQLLHYGTKQVPHVSQGMQCGAEKKKWQAPSAFLYIQQLPGELLPLKGARLLLCY